MQSWKEGLLQLSDWVDNHKLEFDALGLVTFLGAAEVESSVGRLVQSSFVEFLPLLGAFVIAGNRFAGNQPGYKMYNLTKGIETTELAGWFSRWLKAQDLDRTRSIITWKDNDQPSRLALFWIPSLTIGFIFNGLLIILTLLSGDWFGLASAVCMVISIAVKHFLVEQNRAGIDRLIFKSRESMINGDSELAKALVILDDSTIVTIKAPAFLFGGVFTRRPDVPYPRVYTSVRWVGWLAFAVHILSLGSAALYTQIYTVVLLLVATILTAFKFGCQDSKTWVSIKMFIAAQTDDTHVCWLSSKLKAEVSMYPENWCRWPRASEHQDSETPPRTTSRENLGSTESENLHTHLPTTVNDTDDHRPPVIPILQGPDSEQESHPSNNETQPYYQAIANTSDPNKAPGYYTSSGRQDLFVWLDLTDKQYMYLDRWGLIPQDESWKARFRVKNMYFKRMRALQTARVRTPSDQSRSDDWLVRDDQGDIC